MSCKHAIATGLQESNKLLIAQLPKFVPDFGLLRALPLAAPAA
jgi:hypothetical protein